MRRSLTWVLLAAIIGPASAAQTGAPDAPKSSIVVKMVAGGLNHPWSLGFLPDGRLIVTERPGRLRIVGIDGVLSAPVRNLPLVAATGQGGLMDVALASDFATSRRLYLTIAEPRGGANNGTTLVTAELVDEGRDARLDNLRVLFRQEPGHAGGLHFGSRIAIADDGRLFVTLGERYQKDYAQDLSRHWGKIVRLEPDGGIPPDNPFVGVAGAKHEIWSYGHRNPQSAAIHPVTKALWTVEHGPRGGDEINIPLRGRNYGWPVIGYGVDYSGARLHEATQRAGMEQPIYYWAPSIAPSGMAFYFRDLFPQWRGNLFVGALAGQALHRLVLDGEVVVAEEVMLKDLGHRIRDVRVGPDGSVWVLTDDPDGKILRLEPGRRSGAP